jgi:MFS family permease
MAVHTLVYAATGSMWVVALTDQGLGAMAFVWMASVAALGQLVSLTWWGRLVDAYGPRSTISITLLSKTALGFFWLILPPDPTGLLVWSALFYLSWGILDGGQNMGRTRAMMDAVTEENQVAEFNAIMYSGSLGGIIGGIVGGWTFGRISDSEMTLGGFTISLLYLAGMQALTIVVYFISRRLVGYAEQTSARDLTLRGSNK